MARPEDDYLEPEFYYSYDEVERYNNSRNIIRTQENIACKILDLLNLDRVLNKKKLNIIDLGCGPGHTTLFYKKQGYNVVGLDILDKMLEKAEKKGLKVKKGNIINLENLFNKETFDIVVSASAIQWIKPKEIKAVASGIYFILKNNGIGCIQFYPKDEKEAYKILKIFEKNNLKTKLIIQNKEVPKNKLIFLVFKKISLS